MGKHGGKKKKSSKAVEERNTEDKEELKKTVKLVLGEDIRWAQLPLHCSLLQLKEIIHHRFRNSQPFLVKYRDKEGDLVTITSDEELRWAEETAEESQGSMKLHVFQVYPVEDNGAENRREEFIDDWMFEFARMFKENVAFDSNALLNFHELDMKQYHEAMEETVTSEEAQSLFNAASEKFQEMAAIALLNCGNAHMSRASQIRTAHELAREEYNKAGSRYEEALRIKPDFYEGLLALGQQQFVLAILNSEFSLIK